MEHEIDLRPYIQAVWKSWKWILGGVALAVLLVLAYYFLAAPKYRATALVAVVPPQELIQFDPRFEAISDDRPVDAYPELAMSDEVLRTVIAENNSGVRWMEVLRDMLDAEPGSDPSLIRLIVESEDPKQAADLANTWATIFVRQANEVFGDQGDEQLLIYAQQLNNVTQELEAAEQAVIEFEAQSRLALAENELLALNRAQAAYLQDQQALQALLRDVTGLQAQLAAQQNTSISFAEQLAALSLHMQAYESRALSQPPADDASVTNNTFVMPSYQLQVSPEAEQLQSQSRQEQVEALAGLEVAIETIVAEIDGAIGELEPQVLLLQGEVETLRTERERLTRMRDVASETFTSVARKVDEERVSSQDTSRGVRLASEAAVPEEPSSAGLVIQLALAVFAGFAVAVAAVLALQWWRSGTDVRRMEHPPSGTVSPGQSLDNSTSGHIGSSAD